MDTIKLDFNSPDHATEIAIGLWREEVCCIAELNEGLRYSVHAITAAKVCGVLESQAVNTPINLYFRRGLVVLDDLEVDALRECLDRAADEDFFTSQIPLQELPLGFEGIPEYDPAINSFIKPPPRGKFNRYKVPPEDLRVIDIRTHALWEGGPTIMSIRVRVVGKGDYLARLANAQDIMDSFGRAIAVGASELSFAVTVPGLVLTNDPLYTIDAGAATAELARRLYFSTIRECA